MTVGVVAELQGELALECLTVADPRLRLDPGAPRSRVAATDFRVPGSEVAFERKRNLGAPSKRWMEARPKAFEQGELRPIPDRVAGRVRLYREVHAHDGTPRPKLRDRDAIQLAALEAQQLSMRGTRHRSAVAQAQTRSDSCQVVLFPCADDVPPGAAPASLGASIVRSHPAILSEGALPPITWRFGPPGGATSERDDVEASIGPSAGPPGGGGARIGRFGRAQPLVGPSAGPRTDMGRET